MPRDAARLRTARAAKALRQGLASATEPNAAVERLAAAALETSAEAVAMSLSSAGAVLQAVETTELVVFEPLPAIEESRRGAAEEILRRVREALAADELAVALAPVLREASGDAARLLAAAPRPKADASPGWSTVESGAETVRDAAALDAWREDVAQKLRANRRLRIDWSVEERGEEGSEA